MCDVTKWREQEGTKDEKADEKQWKEKGNEKPAREGRGQRVPHRYVTCSPPPAPFCTQSFQRPDVAVRDPGGTHITDNGNLEHPWGWGVGADLHNHDGFV